jgi:hypothetical protein
MSQLQGLVDGALNLHPSIRGTGIVNIKGIQLYFKLRKGLKPLLTELENEEYARNAIERHKNRMKFDRETGGLEYAVVRYENVTRGIIPITNKLYLLIALDVELAEFDNLILKKIIPLVRKYKPKLV